jgi:hypothetical protein
MGGHGIMAAANYVMQIKSDDPRLNMRTDDRRNWETPLGNLNKFNPNLVSARIV